MQLNKEYMKKNKLLENLKEYFSYMRSFSKKDIDISFRHAKTIGDLKTQIKDLPDETPIVIKSVDKKISEYSYQLSEMPLIQISHVSYKDAQYMELTIVNKDFLEDYSQTYMSNEVLALRKKGFLNNCS